MGLVHVIATMRTRREDGIEIIGGRPAFGFIVSEAELRRLR